MNAPFGISICHDKVYITQCSAHSLNVYSTDGGYINSVGTRGENELEFLFPTGVDVSNSFHRIYICDNNNNRVQCFNLNLTFNSYISEVFKPIDIKLTSQDIFIMTQRSSIRIYDYSHILTRVLIDQMDESYHFCLDGRYNILLIEYTNNCVIILSNSGDQLHKFGKTGEGINEFISPAGIVTDTKNRIIVVSQNRDYCIQMF
ncbi:PEP-CTERM domain protein [Oopsacas minuta]|uniref:PEP-CTERM domain protein n=1 Tax=Oopsacas minuta TaxID=111878 RepID=A0AAV7JP82_9METZ|nr:PEP-CTERM domain protein [Oopsacas minuta]